MEPTHKGFKLLAIRCYQLAVRQETVAVACRYAPSQLFQDFERSDRARQMVIQIDCDVLVGHMLPDSYLIMHAAGVLPDDRPQAVPNTNRPT